jgi:hypothetical protein
MNNRFVRRAEAVGKADAQIRRHEMTDPVGLTTPSFERRTDELSHLGDDSLLRRY